MSLLAISGLSRPYPEQDHPLNSSQSLTKGVSGEDYYPGHNQKTDVVEERPQEENQWNLFRLNDNLDFNYIEKFFGQLDGWYYTAGLAALLWETG